ncbi:uncharacterized protein LOC125480645 isoform X1 [Pyrus x bretschneideri]|uniref:uncharacterized protein LOC125480645 isoform X1 n=1 Tax=Pyrus x bretschneideri TaxID=225117 RepID=UPI00203056FB|nr:uncharacterized protein LOC125480645 isoform X1 [Pyrus x bretschneideri]
MDAKFECTFTGDAVSSRYVFTRGGYVAQLPKMKFMKLPDEFAAQLQHFVNLRSSCASSVDDAIWGAENATLKAEMSGKKLMHSWNNLSSTLNFRRFKRGFGILQLFPGFKDYQGA